ncbi:RHS repeat domain-containing protein [Sphingobacterium humi]|uniref:RHS repeat-associated core domain-containing protein n=1 Tax=Sphingobacterium humi TaxID=1796905 RepID=A0A6N8L226_9SPHI|nr:RHS repeat-associated core domain-containing protein [Sphingobacterium humi]MVZ63773.1 hypothetical protein [Sphingobacterium humi]
MQQTNEYDFKGNPLETQQQLLDNATLTDADWSGTPPALSTEVFTSSLTYDALNRPVTTTDAGGNVQAYTYDKRGLLKSVELNSTIYVQDIHYDAKGQRQAIWYGNGTKTSYTYDPETFRLRRLLTVNVDSLSPHYNEVLQDLHYWYDPVGNITQIQDDAQQTLFFNNSVVSPTQKFTYDALYRLIEARGRELIGTATFSASDNWNDSAWQTSHKGNGNAVQNYTQHYTYDEVGNILELQHVATAGSYTRTYNVDTASNRLLSTTVGVNTYSYTHDSRGNMLTMPHLGSMAWNINNELSSITKASEPTHYQYSSGQRIRKFTDKGTVKEERIYLGNYEIYRKYDSLGAIDLERTTVHVSDDTGRIAMLEERTVGTDPSPASLERYIYSNHLQSASLELDGDAEVISYEEYHPYGTTSYQAMNTSINAVAKRYRFVQMERDEESGLYSMGRRYYIPWLARWSAVDMLQSEMPTWSSYNYGFCNPVKWTDTSGMQPDDPPQANNGKFLLTDQDGRLQYTFNEYTLGSNQNNASASKADEIDTMLSFSLEKHNPVIDNLRIHIGISPRQQNEYINNKLILSSGTNVLGLQSQGEGHWYDGIAHVLRSGDAWIDDVMRENWIGNLAGRESSWEGADGFTNKGWPTIKFVGSTLATVFTGGGYALTTTRLFNMSLSGTATYTQTYLWLWDGVSLGVGTYNLLNINNNDLNRTAPYVDAVDVILKNPFGYMNWGFRGIDYYNFKKTTEKK